MCLCVYVPTGPSQPTELSMDFRRLAALLHCLPCLDQSTFDFHERATSIPADI